jgi:DNA mismatch repair protein MutL
VSTNTPPPIRELPPETVRKIAAGEVVERPASVVKELVENSLDAAASAVTVAVEAGGIDRIRVTDDGVGIPADQLVTAVQAHTTSKLDTSDELSRAIDSFGFRGEALHTIGAVARMTVTSRPADAEHAMQLTVEAGAVEGPTRVGAPVGTTVEVVGLFDPTPARRKFLKRPSTEFDHINRIVSRYALTNPSVSVRLVHDDRELFATEGRGSLEQSILAVYGSTVAEGMLPIDETAEAASLHIGGCISDPEVTRANRSYMAIFVNGRSIDDAALRSAVLDGYGRRLASDRYPFTVLELTLDPALIDVNVHPRKMEVRFDEEARVQQAVTAAVEATLRDAGGPRAGAPRGVSAPTPVDPTPERVRPERPRRQRRTPTGGRDDARAQQDLAGAPATVASAYSTLPELEVLGQLDDTYIVCSAPEGLVLIDQHAADERVHYERLQRSFDGAITTQRLAVPLDIPVTPREGALFEGFVDALGALGFEAETVEAETVRVTAVPSIVDTSTGVDALRTVLLAFVEEGVDGGRRVLEELTDELLADMACYPAITGNRSLTEGSIGRLLGQLDACEDPTACPHGRPTMIAFELGEIDDRFERDYPGHGPRRRE